MNGSSHADQICRRIESLAERWSWCSVITGLLVAGWVGTGGLMLAVLLDIGLSLDGGGRLIVMLAWLGVTLLACFYLLLRPALRRRTLAGTARRLELVFPELDSDLINLVQLRRDERTPSPLLRELALEQAARVAERTPLTTAAARLPLRDRVRHGMLTSRDLGLSIAIGIGLLLLGGLLHVSLPQWPHSVYRLFRPGQFVPTLGQAVVTGVTPGDTELLLGEGLTITATVENPRKTEHDGFLVVRKPDGTTQRHPLATTDDFDAFSFTLPSVAEAFRYRVEIGGTQSDHFDVTVFDRPAVTGISATYLPPGYTGLPERTEELDGGALSAPQFTIAELKIRTTAPVAKAWLTHGGERVPASTLPGENLVTARLPLVEDGTYTIHLEDARGTANLDPPPHAIRVTPDQPPSVTVREPAGEITAAPGSVVKVAPEATDDHGLSLVEIRWRLESASPEAETVVTTWKQPALGDALPATPRHEWALPADLPIGGVILYRAVVLDNRRVDLDGTSYGPQEAFSAVGRIRLIDRETQLNGKLQSLESMRQELWRIFKRQTDACLKTVPLTLASDLEPARETAEGIRAEQVGIREQTQQLVAAIVAETDALRAFRTTLSNVADGRMQQAVNLAEQAVRSDRPTEFQSAASELVTEQRDILDILRKLLDLARAETSKTLAEMERRPGGDLPPDVTKRLEELRDKLKEFADEQRKVIEASEDLAKKPVEDFSEKDEQLLKQLAEIEDDWSKFLKEEHSDLSKLPEQDFSNPSLLEELIEVFTEIKMAEDALTKKAVEIAVPLEQLGVEHAEEMTTNIEKWLPDTPDRERWSQEEPLTDAMKDAPAAELPHELEDLVGELMEEEDDLFDELEDISSSWNDSLDKGAGWDALDGPISNMSARGVTGNRLPNKSEIGGRSGEGRSGKSSGEFVGDSAVGKGGRKTPSRLTPDVFEAGQVKDTSTDPVGGATGGGKESGQGGEGLEGPLPPQLKRELGRLAGKQASLRNKAESVRLQFKIANYNTESLDELLQLMKRTEQHLRSGHFKSALRRRDVVLETAGDLRTQAEAMADVARDRTNDMPRELKELIDDGMDDPAPEGWEKLNRTYFERIASGK